MDQSEKLSILNEILDFGKIGDLKDACNKVLFPDVLCPWGCTEFIHEFGSFPIDFFNAYFANIEYILLQRIKKEFISLNCHVKIILGTP